MKELRFEVVEVDLLPVRCISVVLPTLLCSFLIWLKLCLFVVSKALQRRIASFDDEEPDGGVTFSFGIPDVKIHLVPHHPLNFKIFFSTFVSEVLFSCEK